MNDRNDMNPSDPAHEGDALSPAMSMDVLIGRIVDGEATTAQRHRFETLAADDAVLWRRLALRQQDMAMLATHVEPALNSAERVDLPQHAEGDAAVLALRGGRHGGTVIDPGTAATAAWPWWLAVSGWAAVITLAVVWGSGIWIGHDHIQRNAADGLSVDTRLLKTTPEEHLQQYMQAPYVVGNMPETLLQVDQLPDGRWAVSFLRRIVEVEYYDSPEQIPLDSDGNFSSSPRALRHNTDKLQPLPQPQPRD